MTKAQYMQSSYINNLLRSHQAWVDQGLQLEDILNIHDELKDKDPFSNIGYRSINRKLGIEPSTHFEPENISYLYIDDREFDGDLSVFSELKGLRSLSINGTCIGIKITDVQPLVHNKDLVSLDLRNNSISSLKPLLALDGLKYLMIKENPINDLEVLDSIRGLEYLGFIDLEENLVSKILRNNKDCLIEYCDRKIGDCYHALNIGSFPVRVTSYFVEDTPNLIIELTFIGMTYVPVPIEKVKDDERIFKAVQDRISKEIRSINMERNVIYLELAKRASTS